MEIDEEYLSFEKLKELKDKNQLSDINLEIYCDGNYTKNVITNALEDLSTDEICLYPPWIRTSGIDITDIECLTPGSTGILIACMAKVHPEVQSLANEMGLEIRTYDNITDFVNDFSILITGKKAEKDYDNVFQIMLSDKKPFKRC